MSTTITDDQTLRNVAATLHSALSVRSDNIKAKTQALLNSLSIEKGNASPSVEDIHSALRERNVRSIEENYPHLDEYTTLAKSQSMSPVNADIDTIPLSNVDGVIFFIQQLGRIEQGLFGEQSTDLAEAIEDLTKALAFRLVTLNAPEYNAQTKPDIRDIVDQISQLSTHGDYLFGLQNGFRTMIAQLEIAASSPGMHYGDDIFITMLNQAYQSGPIVVPVGNSKFDTSVRHNLRNPNYNISADVPMPNLVVAENVSRALAFLAHRLDIVPLIDTDGNEVDPSTKEDIKNVFLNTASSMILRSNHLRFESYSGLEGISFSKALERKKNNYTQNKKLFLVSYDDFEPIIPPEKRDHRLSLNAQLISERINQGNGKVMPVSTIEDVEALKQKSPFLSVEEIDVSSVELSQLATYGNMESPLSATHVLLRNAVQDAHESLGLDDDANSIEKGPISVAMIDRISSAVPGLDDTFAKAIEKAVANNYPSHTTQTPKYVVRNILSELPAEYVANIQSPGAPRTISPSLEPTRERSGEDIPYGRPSLTR
ncbi:hypothetical protein BM525_20085 (plasmid) [Alteromonas mediterranea]|uniref:Uncharacterized protein n=1 Tax=Alteromonas mediterranea TaxID=314275 RepID=A0AAC9JEE2_9ALTE|nr:hypothetical protein [Alteromonas mediterranea]APD92183.1 hypothetical protein BM524_19890 [Alteromonas mediterranea]APE00038.1 hypothetical protein BM525_20085 [Alteromonas mediterranea]